MDISTLGAAKSYTDSAINGLSILVGKNCEISNIEVLPNGNKITFTWWDSNNVQQSNDITVLNGEQGEKGEKGEQGIQGEQGLQGEQGIQGLQGVSITNVEINEEHHLILTLSDSTIIDAGEIVNDVTNYEDLDNKPKINGVELIGNKSTSDLGIEIPTVTNDLTNVLKSNYDTAYTHSQSAHAPVNAEANVQSDWNETDNTSDAFIKNKPTSLPASDVSSWAKATNKPTYSKSEIGLGNVDNTSDLDKPISNATSTALGNKVDKVTGKGLSTNDYTNAEKDKLASAFKYTKFEGNAIKFYNTQSITSSSVPTFTIDLPVDWVLDLSQTTLVQNFIWSDELYPNSANPNLDGLPVLVLAISDNTNATYSFLNMNSLIDVYVGGNTNSASVAVNDTTGKITCNVKVSSVTNNAITTKSDGLHVDISSKANIVHNHTTTDITDFPTSMPASDVSSWAKATNKPTYSKSEIGLGNVDNTADTDKPISTAMNNALALKANATDLYALGIDYDNGTSGLLATNVQEAVDELNTNKATTTALTTHTGDTNVHVTAADKTAWNTIPKSKAYTFAYVDGNEDGAKDFVIPIICISNTRVNEYFYGQIFLKRNNAANKQATIINITCFKNYNEEKALYCMDRSEVWTDIRPCTFAFNGEKFFGIHANITSGNFQNIAIDARTTTNFDTISPVFVYNNNTSAVINAEIQNSLSFFDGYNIPIQFYETPKVVKYDGATLSTSKLLSFSSAPTTLTSTGTAGEIAYDSGYMYVCVAENTWKRIALTTW